MSQNMEPFLLHVAQQILDENPTNLDKVAVVFNNWRSGLFLRNQFTQLSHNRSAFFLPQIVGMDDLVSQLTDLQITPREFLLFELFKIHCDIEKQALVNPSDNTDTPQKEPKFEEFISSADMMLNDFSEIDLYRVDAQQLFGNLHDIKQIGEWDIEGTQHTPLQERYLQFYKSLYTYYIQLHRHLKDQKRAYSGMAYREAAENIDSMIDRLKSKYNRIYFVGFNVLSKCEYAIIHSCVQNNMGTLITDGDSYYYQNPDQEAGLFLRNKHMDFSEIGNYEDHFAQEERNITIVSCPTSVLQAKYAGQILRDINTPDNTALILADESLLLPSLNALPENITTANVTMGFPYEYTAVHNLVLKIFSLHTRVKNGSFHHKDITDIFSDNIICNILGTSNLHAKVTRQLAERGIIYANKENIADMIGMESLQKIDFLFSECENKPQQFMQVCQKLIQTILDSTLPVIDTEATETDQSFDQVKEEEALACFSEIVDYFNELQTQYQYIEKIETLQKIYTRIAHRRSITFYGEPLAGLQILGMLETRNLDFDTIVMLGVNEGVLPAGRTPNTLIPYSLKRGFGIPTHTEYDAVYAYHFYRLLQRAKNVYLLFSTEDSGLGKGAPSRFILQIRTELAQHYPNIHIVDEVLSLPIPPSAEVPPLVGEKTAAVMQRLREMADKGFSPSALNVYLGCPLKFYYEYVLKIREQEDVSEDIDQSELGTFIHTVLEHIYSSHPNNNVQVVILKEHLANIDTLLNDTLKEILKGRNPEGRNHFLASVARMQITNFLRQEIKYLESGATIKILQPEKTMNETEQKQCTLEINNDGILTKVVIQGRADRIDLTNGKVRIIDYKSGKVDAQALNITQKAISEGKIPDKWFQVMTYAWIYSRLNPVQYPFTTGIYPLQNLSSGFIPASIDGQQDLDANVMNDFQELLTGIVSQIFNPKEPFLPNSKKLCIYCPFASTCGTK